MARSDVPTKQLLTGFVVGAVALFVVVFAIAALAGADLLIAFLAALFVGLVAGGGVGFMFAAQRSSRS